VIRTSRVGLTHAAFLLFAVVLVGRAAQVQLFQTEKWRVKARHQQLAASPLPAPRGMILDESGAMLVESRQLVRLNVAPREIFFAGDNKKHPEAGKQHLNALANALAHASVSSEWIARATDTSRTWVVIPGRFLMSDVAPAVAMHGVHSVPILERVPPANDGLRRLVGHADDAGEPVDGLEKALDHVLRGEAGHTALLRDAKGTRFDSPTLAADDAKPGQTVVLTVNQTLQDIAEKALSDAVHHTGAAGGDIVMLDPNSGEVRAMASSRSDPLSTSATALTEPYEPGSTLKPFVAARLLDMHRARVDEVMNTYNGKWELNGRKIEDDHPAPSFSLADVIRFSSNIGIVQFAMRFSPREQYELLRDVGFGSPTGLPYAAEESGRLPTPQRWDKQTPASLAMGYALNVTPLQLANAYAAIANGGELLQPSVIKEIRATDGTVLYRHKRTVVRRVMTDETARTVRGLLRGVVEGGTGDSASLATFDVAGKTGTAKLAVHGKYVPGKYTASFVALFPADKPQLVVLVKLDNPSSTIYGGKAAAPVLKTVLLAAIAARDASLDRKNLAAVPKRAEATVPLADSVTSADSIVRVTESGSVPYVYRLDSPKKSAVAAIAARSIPDVRGFPVRRAVYALHRAGFRVSLAAIDASGSASATAPPAGTMVPSGSTVRLVRAP
jgi:cell division protein FtsI (penicillin-binding protein 3)